MPSSVPLASPDAGLHAYLRRLAKELDAILRSTVREYEGQQVAWDKAVEGVYTAARQRVEQAAASSSSGGDKPKSLDSAELSRSLVLETTCPGPNRTDRAVDFLLLEVEGFLSSSAPFKGPTVGEEPPLAAERIGGVGIRSREGRLQYAARSAVFGSLPISSMRDVAGIVGDGNSRLDDSEDGDQQGNAHGLHSFDFPTTRREDDEQDSLIKPSRAVQDADVAWEAREEKQHAPHIAEMASVYRSLAPLECKLLDSHLARLAPSAACSAALLWRTYLCSWFGSSVQDRMSVEGYISYRVSRASSVGMTEKQSGAANKDNAQRANKASDADRPTPGFLGELGVSLDSIRDAFFVFSRYAQLRETSSIGAITSTESTKEPAKSKDSVVHPDSGPASPSAVGGSFKASSAPSVSPSAPRAWFVGHLSLSRWLSKSQLDLFLRSIHLSESARSTLVQFFFERTDQTSGLCSYVRFLRRWLLLDHLTRVVLRNNADPSVRAGLGHSVAPSREASMVQADLARHGQLSHSNSTGPNKPTLSPQNAALLQAFAHLSRQLRQSAETALEADQMDDGAAASDVSADLPLVFSPHSLPAALPSTHVYVLTRLEKAFFWFWGTLVLSAGWVANSDDLLLSWQLCRMRSWLWSKPWMIQYCRLSSSLEQEARRVHHPRFSWRAVAFGACCYSSSYLLSFIFMSAQVMRYGEDTYQLIPSRVPFFLPGVLMLLISIWASYACLTEPNLPPKRILHAVGVDCRSGESDHPFRRVSNMEQLIMHMELEDAARTFKQAMYQRWDQWHKWSNTKDQPQLQSKAAALAAKLRGPQPPALEPLVLSVSSYVHPAQSSGSPSPIPVRSSLDSMVVSTSWRWKIMLVAVSTELAVLAWCQFVFPQMSQMNALSSTPYNKIRYNANVFDDNTRDALPDGFLCPSTPWSFSANSTDALRSKVVAAAIGWDPAMSPCAQFCDVAVRQLIGGGTVVVAECALTGSMLISIVFALWWVVIACALCGVMAPFFLYFQSQRSLVTLQRFTALVSRVRSPALFLPLRSTLNIQSWLLLRDDQKHMLRVVSRDTANLLNPVVLTVVCCLLVVILATAFKAAKVMTLFVAPVCVVLSVSVGVVVWALFNINGEFDRGADVLHSAIWQTNTEKAHTLERAQGKTEATTTVQLFPTAQSAQPAVAPDPFSSGAPGLQIAIDMAPPKGVAHGPASKVPDSVAVPSDDHDPNVTHARLLASLDSRKDLLLAARDHVLFEQGKVGFTVFGFVVSAGVIKSLGLQALVAGAVALINFLFKK